jgi:hypothetical protein
MPTHEASNHSRVADFHFALMCVRRQTEAVVHDVAPLVDHLAVLVSGDIQLLYGHGRVCAAMSVAALLAARGSPKDANNSISEF